jgi:hypothetical protein
MQRGPRQKLDGDGWDWCHKKARWALGWNRKRGWGKYVKRKLARRRRRAPIEPDE